MEGLEAGAVIDMARVMLDDTTGRHRWPREFLLRALDEAQREAAFRARLLYDDETDEVCRIQLTPGIGEYAVDPRVFEIDEVRRLSDGQALRRVTLDELARTSPRWRSHRAHLPRCVLIDRLTAFRLRITIYPGQAESDEPDTLVLGAFRYPLETIEDESDELEIPPQSHERLANWLCYRAYLDRDPDRYDPVRAQTHLEDFTRAFGPGRSLHEEMMRTPRREWTTRPRRV